MGLTLLLGVLCTASAAFACIWDYDTLAMERKAFPDALELITGRFPRHGEAFYRWRIANREARLAEAPDELALYDDLAVAYEKTGNVAKAIEIMQAKAARKPGVYETEANLGTFHIHAGNLERGLEHIERAIAINPDAHFGREIYQALLVRYVLTKRAGGPLVLPLDPDVRHYGTSGFASFVATERPLSDSAPDGAAQAEAVAAVKGVLGMMHFGNFESPVLLEVLADLLLSDAQGYHGGQARRLAARAFLKASYAVEGEARVTYRAKAEGALASQTPDPHSHTNLGLDVVEEDLGQELAAAATWYAELLANEARWVRDDPDPEARFAETYYGVPAAADAPPEKDSDLPILLVIAIVLAVNGILFALMTRRRRR
ncbi:MAG: hypothetical protein O2894_07975 [Planctomycetota bacterium]|nr:hypothetical protein [Planctomycetota bacterium]